MTYKGGIYRCRKLRSLGKAVERWWGEGVVGEGGGGGRRGGGRRGGGRGRRIEYVGHQVCAVVYGAQSSMEGLEAGASRSMALSNQPMALITVRSLEA